MLATLLVYTVTQWLLKLARRPETDSRVKIASAVLTIVTFFIAGGTILLADSGAWKSDHIPASIQTPE